MKARAASGSKQTAPVDVEALLQRVDEAIARQGALTRKEFSALKRHLSLLTPGLEARGYEVGSTIRQPLERQLLDLTAAGFVPMKGIEKRTQGASASEVKASVAQSIKSGKISLVLRESGVGLVQTGPHTIEADELAEVSRWLKKAHSLASKAASKKGSALGVLREDILSPLRRWLPVEPEVVFDRVSPSRVDALAEEIRTRVLAESVPVRVPELLRKMNLTADEGGRALLHGATRGFFDLEPESGMARLSSQDAALCPQGPMGTRLSWILARRDNSGAPR